MPSHFNHRTHRWAILTDDGLYGCRPYPVGGPLRTHRTPDDARRALMLARIRRLANIGDKIDGRVVKVLIKYEVIDD